MAKGPAETPPKALHDFGGPKKPPISQCKSAYWTVQTLFSEAHQDINTQCYSVPLSDEIDTRTAISERYGKSRMISWLTLRFLSCNVCLLDARTRGRKRTTIRRTNISRGEGEA